MGRHEGLEVPNAQFEGIRSSSASVAPDHFEAMHDFAAAGSALRSRLLRGCCSTQEGSIEPRATATECQRGILAAAPAFLSRHHARTRRTLLSRAAVPTTRGEDGFPMRNGRMTSGILVASRRPHAQRGRLADVLPNNAMQLTGLCHAPCCLGSAPQLPKRWRARGAPLRPAADRGR